MVPVQMRLELFQLDLAQRFRSACFHSKQNLYFQDNFFRTVTTKTARAGDSQFTLMLNDDLGITEAKWYDFVTYTFQGMVIEQVYFNTQTWLPLCW